MTAKSLHKKIERSDPWSTGKAHKRHIPTRPKAQQDADKEIQQGIDNPVELCLCDHLDQIANDTHHQDEQLLDSLGFVDPIKPVKWSTNKELSNE